MYRVHFNKKIFIVGILFIILGILSSLYILPDVSQNSNSGFIFESWIKFFLTIPLFFIGFGLSLFIGSFYYEASGELSDIEMNELNKKNLVIKKVSFVFKNSILIFGVLALSFLFIIMSILCVPFGIKDGVYSLSLFGIICVIVSMYLSIRLTVYFLLKIVEVKNEI